MKAFLGMNIYRGVVRISKTKAYWSKATYVPAMAKVMPARRFCALNGAISMIRSSERKEEKEEKKNADMWAKIRPALSAVRAACMRDYHAGQYLTVDEQIIKYSGRHTAIQRMQS